MIHKTPRLRLSAEDVKHLKDRFGKVIKHLGQIEQLVLAKGITTYYKEHPGDFTK